MVGTREIRKIKQLEKSVLGDLPDEPKLYISNDAEIALYKKADKIRSGLDCDEDRLFSPKYTLKDRKAYAVELMNKISDSDYSILNQDYMFNKIRLRDLMFNFFKDRFPKVAYDELNTRIMWFLTEMEHLGYREMVIDDEWNFNRDEDDPDFDDFAWWARVDALIKEEYPDGIFTQKTFENMRDWFDTKLSERIGQYYREHPEEHKKLMDTVDKRLAEVKAND